MNTHAKIASQGCQTDGSGLLNHEGESSMDTEGQTAADNLSKIAHLGTVDRESDEHRNEKTEVRIKDRVFKT